MSSFRVNLTDSEPSIPDAADNVPRDSPEIDKKPGAKKGKTGKVLRIAAILLVSIGLIAAVSSYLYWQSLKGTPQYSLALLVDAAKRDDQAGINEVIDVDAVVDDFLPQVTNKAVELYGKGLPPAKVEQVAKLSAPLVPAIKDRVRAELPRLIRERSEKFGNVPFILMVLGATHYLDISITGDIAQIKSTKSGAPLEVKMKRNGKRWQIVGVKDEQLATQIAQKIGQQMIAIAANGGINKTINKLGVKDMPGLLKQAQDILNK